MSKKQCTWDFCFSERYHSKWRYDLARYRGIWKLMKDSTGDIIIISHYMNYFTASLQRPNDRQTTFTGLFNSLKPSDAYMRHWNKHHWFKKWLVAWTAPRHYLNQCWNIVNWTLRNKFQWNFNRNSNICIEENTFENVVCEMSAIFSRPQCVKAEGIPLLVTWAQHALQLI